MDATFAALMSKAKANTQAQSGLAQAKQAELEAAKKREAEIEAQNAAKERERKRKELEARRKREEERLLLEEKLRQEREQKRAQKEKEQLAASSSVSQVAKKGVKLPSATEPIPSVDAKIVSVALKKKRRIDAIFSDDDDTSDASASRKSGSNNRKHRANVASGKAARASSALSSPADTLSAKEKLKLQFDPTQLRSLNENRRDVRTIEEIEQDYRRKQALAQPSSSQTSSHGLFASRKTASTASQTPSATATQQTGTSSQNEADSSAPVASSSKTVAQSSSKARDNNADVVKRKRTASPVEPRSRKLESRSRSPPRKRPASPMTSSPPPKLSKTEARRQEIWAILNPHKASAPGFGAAYAGDDYSDDDDMEAGIDDIEEEDRRAARIARLEDKREEERLKQRAREKAAKKNAKSSNPS